MSVAGKESYEYATPPDPIPGVTAAAAAGVVGDACSGGPAGKPSPHAGASCSASGTQSFAAAADSWGWGVAAAHVGWAISPNVWPIRAYTACSRCSARARLSSTARDGEGERGQLVLLASVPPLELGTPSSGGRGRADEVW